MSTKNMRLSVIGLLALIACENAHEDTEETPSAEELFACDMGGFMISKPLVGPGFDPAQGGVIGELQPTYVVHTTQLFLRPDKIAEFQAIADPVSVQLDQTEGLLAYSYAGDQGCGEASTLAIWASEAAMYRFIATGAHAEAMGQASEVGQAGRVTHWTVTGAEANLIDWTVARAKIRAVEASSAFY